MPKSPILLRLTVRPTARVRLETLHLPPDDGSGADADADAISCSLLRARLAALCVVAGAGGVRRCACAALLFETVDERGEAASAASWRQHGQRAVVGRAELAKPASSLGYVWRWAALRSLEEPRSH